jgi:hypothetical protein
MDTEEVKYSRTSKSIIIWHIKRVLLLTKQSETWWYKEIENFWSLD